MTFLKKILLICLLTVLGGNVFAQKRCGFEERFKIQHQQNSQFIKERFEHWISDKKSQIRAASTVRKKSDPYLIPVVVHIIHNGESVGSGSNISDEQVFSQIKVLNNDFRRTNADANNTPAEFLTVAGSMDIQFVLAKRTPDGLPTNGIVRVNGNRSSWTSSRDVELKKLSYWSSEDYLNVWVCNLTDYLGYSQFPVSDLPGLEGSPDNAETDGVVIAHTCFGSLDDGNFNLESGYDKGRTTTHEISHYFGLKHIWGDDGSGCTASDYVDDTPNQAGFTTGCPSHPVASCSPSLNTMFQNFLDYTDDRCMNLFTVGQVERMGIVLENSPRRKSLLTSQGLSDPSPTQDDIALQSLEYPNGVICNPLVSPEIIIKNAGTNPITKFTLQLSVDNQVKQVMNFSGTLDPQQKSTLTLSPVTLAAVSNISIEVLSVNNFTDGNPANNLLSKVVAVNEDKDILPLRVNFDNATGDSWESFNIVDKNGMTWETNDTNEGLSLMFNSFGNSDIGDEAWFVSPLLDLSTTSVASMVFDMAYKNRGNIQDYLRIYVSPGCGESYENISFSLPSFGKNSNDWIPTSSADWVRDLEIDLQSYVGKENVRIAFAVENKNGNNMYLDNIEFYLDDKPNEVSVDGLFNIYGYSSSDPEQSQLKIIFYLKERTNVQIQLTDLMGRLISETNWNNVLNQKFDLPIKEDLQAGLYITRVKFNGKVYSSRIYIR